MVDCTGEQQTYQVGLTLLVRRHPEWLINFLMTIPAQTYVAKNTFGEAKAALHLIVSMFADTRLLTRRPYLRQEVTDDSFYIVSCHGYPYIRFYIEHH